jgi:CRP/FNR family transcriptional regulator, cyclic AMP receptor protein
MRLEDFLAGEAQKKTFKKGELVITEKTQASAAFFIVEGQVEIFKGPVGKETSIAKLGHGQIFGEMALLRYDEYTLSARALTDVSVFVITPSMLQKELRATHPLIRAILDMLVERMHNTNETLIDLDLTQTLPKK